MKNKNLISLFALSLLTLAGCGNNATSSTPESGGTPATGNKETITLWVDEKVVEISEGQIATFMQTEEMASFKDSFKIEVKPQSESNAASDMITDVENGADVYCFAQDQLARLVSADALSEIKGSLKTELAAANDSASIMAATLGDALWAYPLTSDNGYFMYYDKRVISEDKLTSLEDIIAACESASKSFSFQLGTDGGWYAASFFFATGCHSNWVANSEGKFTTYDDTFWTEKGLIALKGMEKLVKSSCYNSSSQAADFNANSAVVVSGTWDYETAKTALGENLGVAPLPSFTVDGQSYHLGSFSGNKLVGVKPQTSSNRAVVANLLAKYITNESSQMERFTKLGWGPSNKNVQASDAVKAAPHLLALGQQAEYAIPQGQFPDGWWALAAAIAPSVQNGDDLQTILSTYHAGLEGIVATATAAEDYYVLVGAWNGWSNPDILHKDDSPVLLVKQDDGTYKVEVVITDEVVAETNGAIGRICKNGEWGNDMGYSQVVETPLVEYYEGDNNFKFASAGTYVVVLDLSSGTPVITVTKKD